jgi:hypothetical protein
MFGRVVTILAAFTISVVFIITLTSIPLGSRISDVKIGGSSSGQEGGHKASTSNLQTCPGGTKGSQAIFDAAEAKYASLRDDKFT